VRKNAIVSVNERGSSAGSKDKFVGRVEGEEAGSGVVHHRVSFATSLMKKIDGDGSLATIHNAGYLFYKRIGWGE